MAKLCRRPLAIFSGALLVLASSSVAQQPVERIQITGSRLPSLTLEGPSPVTVLTAQEIKLDGLAKAEDVLRWLPLSLGFHQNSSLSNGASGTAEVNLRGLGAYRNLVLVNGRRMNLGSPSSPPADLNQVPVGLIQRVEVLTGGASAVYGADAVAGVVNFILNDKFEGLQVTYGHSFFNHSQGNPVSGIVAQRAVTNPSQFVVPNDVASDGDIHNVSVLLGSKFADGRGNATVYFDWKKEDAVLQSSRDFSACSLNPGVIFTCGGSPTSYPGRFFLNQGSFTLDRPSGLLRPFSPAFDQFNYGPYNYYRRPSNKYGFGAFAHYNVLNDLTAYVELLYHNDRTVAQIAPSGLFAFDASGPNAIRAGNPLLTPQWIQALTTSNASNVDLATGLPAPLPFDANNPASILIGRRNIEGGARQHDLAHASFRFVFGLKGAAFRYWDYDVSMQTGRVEVKGTYRNDLSKTRIGRALNAVRDASGNVVCQSVLDGTDPNCVPYNPWVLGGVTADSVAYLQVPGVASGYTQRQILTTSWTADLGAYGLKLPTARNGVSIVLGAEHRKDKMELTTDNAMATGDLAGQDATIGSEGRIQVSEYFGELRVPFVEKHPMTDLLQLSASYRYSKYSTDKKSNTYGIGLEWAPVSVYRFRSSYQRAARVADLLETFLPQSRFSFNLPGDPCGPAMRATLAQCERSGITVGNYGRALLDSPSTYYNSLGGGNPKLNPETGDTVTLGLVFQPARDLSGSIDYWNIKIDGTIALPEPSVILNQCVFSNQFCDLVQRDRFGTLWALPEGHVVALANNLGATVSKGWDLAADYVRAVGRHGKFRVHFLGTRVTRQETEIIKGLGKFDCVGLWAGPCPGAIPKWRHKIRATWMTPWNAELTLTWRHISKVRNADLHDPFLAATVAPTDRELGRRDYLDIAGVWRINKTFTVSAGVNNLADRDPPIVSAASGPNGNTLPGVYDTLGRLVFINLQSKF